MAPTHLVLFDIDGTLIHSGPGWKETFFEAVSHLLDAPIRNPTMPFAGKTDGQICREILTDLGKNAEMLSSLVDKMMHSYLELAQRKISKGTLDVQLLPGVREVLDLFKSDDRILLGLLTGNYQRGSKLKLGCAGIDHYFKTGAWGDDHWERKRLPAFAAKRAKDDHGHDFPPDRVVIIGDTILDIDCARHHGAKVIAVGTGRGINQDQLRALKPDHYFETLHDAEAVRKAVFGRSNII